MTFLRQPILTVLGHVDHGKCVSGDTLLSLPDGKIITAKNFFEECIENSQKIDSEYGEAFYLSKEKQLISFNGDKMINSKVTYAWRHEEKELIKIKLSNGEIIKCTKEHPFLAFSPDFCLYYKQASDLTLEDVVAVPSKLEFTPTKTFENFIIEKLAEAKNLVIFIDEEKAKEFIIKYNKINIEELRRKKILSTTSHHNDNRFRSRDFVKISKYFGFSDKQTYYFIKSIKNAEEKRLSGKTSLKIKLPENFSQKEFGYICGLIAGDGSMKPVNLHGNDLEVLEAYKKTINSLFGIEGKIKKGHPALMCVSNGSKTFTRFLSEIIGIPSENKSGTVFVPEVIKNSKEMFRGFFEGLFDTDGYVSLKNNSFELTSKSEQLIKECSILLLQFGIQTTIGRKNIYWTLRISNKEFLEIFLKEFHPKLSRRLERIKKVVEKTSTSRNFDVYPINKETTTILTKSMKTNINEIIPYFQKYMQHNKISRRVLVQISKNLKNEKIHEELKAFLNTELKSVKVIGIKKIINEEKHVYDFTIKDYHNFVANRTIVHNTTLLDTIRKTKVTQGEAGGITQKISATEININELKKTCIIALEKMRVDLKIPGLLLVDTPGHEDFTNLRKIGGNLADIAILVIDLNAGIQNQTIEALQILKEYKTPFVIALNKIDSIRGWKSEASCLTDLIAKQRQDVQDELDKKIYELVGNIYQYGFNAERFDRIQSFGKEIIIVPISAKNGDGVAELLLYVAGLSQKFLEENLKQEENAQPRIAVLEVKEETGLGKVIHGILYQGTVKTGNEILISTLDGVKKNKVKSLWKKQKEEEIKPASALILSCDDAKNAIAGSNIIVVRNNEEEEKETQELNQELKNIFINTEKEGVIIKTDSLGSIEALSKLLGKQEIPIKSARIGKVTKKDISEATAVKNNDSILGVILAFNTEIEKDAAEEGKVNQVKIFDSKVIYNLIEDYKNWKEAIITEERKNAFQKMPLPCKIQFLRGSSFRQNNPAVIGVEVLVGQLRKGISLMKEDGTKIATVKEIQKDKEKIDSAKKGEQVAISLEGITIGRQINEGEDYITDLTEDQIKTLEEKYMKSLNDDEKLVLQQIKKLRITTRI